VTPLDSPRELCLRLGHDHVVIVPTRHPRGPWPRHPGGADRPLCGARASARAAGPPARRFAPRARGSWTRRASSSSAPVRSRPPGTASIRPAPARCASGWPSPASATPTCTSSMGTGRGRRRPSWGTKGRAGSNPSGPMQPRRRTPPSDRTTAPRPRARAVVRASATSWCSPGPRLAAGAPPVCVARAGCASPRPGPATVAPPAKSASAARTGPPSARTPGSGRWARPRSSPPTRPSRWIRGRIQPSRR
jgi:hypothetical protein